MEPLQNGNGNPSPLQRLAIGAGALIVVVLTVIAAVFLAMQDLPKDDATPVSQLSPTVLSVDTPVRPPTSSPTEQTQLPTATLPVPTLAPPLTETPLPSVEPTQIPATATFTPVPNPPTFTPVPPPPTFTPVPPPPTPTPLSAQLTGCGSPPPAGWVAYTVAPGDTYDTLSTRVGTSVFDLRQANCLEFVQSARVIFLPVIPATPTATSVPASTSTRSPTPTRTGTPFAPRIFSVIARQTSTEIVVIVEGENFRSQEVGFRAELVGPTTIILNVGGARTSTSFEASAPIPGDLPPVLPSGSYDLIVFNPDGRLDTAVGVFPPNNATPTATPAPPEIIVVSPSSGGVSDEIRVTIQGRNFKPLMSGFKVELRSDSGGLTVEFSVDETERAATSTSFDIVIGAGALNVGEYDLLVTNPDGQTDIQRDAYTGT